MATVAALALVAGACGTDKLATSRAEDKIPHAIKSQYPHVSVGTTTCHPDKVKLKEGVTFSCRTSIDAQPVMAKVREEDDKGHVGFQLNKTVVGVARTEKDLGRKLTAQQDQGGGNAPARATCPGPRTRVLAVHEGFRCNVTANSAVVAYQVIACGLGGQLAYVPAAEASDPAKACTKASAKTGKTPGG